MGIIADLNESLWKKIKGRFMQRVRVDADGCWRWIGTNNGTYPTFYVLGVGKLVYAHRLAFELFKEPVIGDNVVMHICDTPLCVNPAHLIQGTQQENMLDKTAKGRAAYPGPRRAASGVANAAAVIDPTIASAIRAAYVPGETSYRTISQQFGLSKSQVFRIIKGDHWSPPSPESPS